MTNLAYHVSRIRYQVSRITYHAIRLALSFLIVAALGAPAASAQSPITIEDGGVEMEFPERLTFRVHVESSAEIERVTLEYGVEKLTCGAVVAKVFPEFEPGRSSDVSWTWEMLQSGSEPPGATIWYRWRVTDKAGDEAASDEQRVIWLDEEHDWQSISQGLLTFHWYGASRRFAEDLLNSAVDSLDQLGQTTGVAPESPIDMYIYADTADMRAAVLYEPGWTGGQAYAEHDIVIIGISPDQIDWGKDTEAHELTHVLVGHLTFSCLGDVPTWLNEGIAVYGEGGLDAASEKALKEAIGDDRLISVRALSGGFSEVSDKADLSYSQSYSIVNFLVERYGREKLLGLFTRLRDGVPIEDALKDVYGFGLDELEDGWRASIGAKPRRAEGAQPTPTPVPTPVPTYRPVSGAPLASAGQATLAPMPTATSAEVAEAQPSPAPTEAQPGAAPAQAAQPGALVIVAAIAAIVAIGAIALAARSWKSL